LADRLAAALFMLPLDSCGMVNPFLFLSKLSSVLTWRCEDDGEG
jgi:hypothetical protein